VTLGTRILIGLALGIALGLFVGELAAPLKVVGDIFVGLLQMTVLPYIIVSLIANVGRLSLERGRALVGRAAVVWILLLAIGAVVLVVMSFAFPDRRVPSFFSAGLVGEPIEFDFLALFVPANVFESIVNNAVPSVVLFCVCAGIALVGVADKEKVIHGLDAVAEMMARVNGFVVRLTPYGVFAIAAAAAGTMTLEEFGRLRGYLLVYTLTAFLLTFWILPAVVSACTPFTYREIFRCSRDALLTAFATGKVLVVLPMLVQNTRQMFEERELRDEEIGSSIDVLYPLIYPFPYLGKLLALLFIPFAAAFVGRYLELGDFPGLLGLGTLSLFGGPILAIPFLLEAQQLPSDMFQLFLLSGVLTARFGDIVGVMNLLAFTALTTCALTGSLRVRWRKLGVAFGIGALLVAVASGGSRAWLDSTKGDYARGAMVTGMHHMDANALVDAVVLQDAEPNPVPLGEGQSHLERIRERGVLRVGINDDNLPYAFRNADGDLVGMDVEMAHRLARDLGATLEFVPFERDTLARHLAEDHFDIAMSGLIGTVERSNAMRLSEPYLLATASLVVRDYRARELDTHQEIVRVPSLRVGILGESQLARQTRLVLPQMETVVVASIREFFETEHDLDALLISAEAGAAWTILYPDFQVVVPTRGRVSMPLVYALPKRDEDLAEFVDFWISIQRGMKVVDNLYDHWIRGEGSAERGPRWSVLRDVLGWID
jgi:Na+/H+-dicarboxylate symporter